MLKALILICSLSATPDLAQCRPANARAVMHPPETYSNPVTCALHGQAYVAETAIERSLDEADRIKVICLRETELEKALANLQVR
jgi:hypothetical protein